MTHQVSAVITVVIDTPPENQNVGPGETVAYTVNVSGATAGLSQVLLTKLDGSVETIGYNPITPVNSDTITGSQQIPVSASMGSLLFLSVQAEGFSDSPSTAERNVNVFGTGPTPTPTPTPTATPTPTPEPVIDGSQRIITELAAGALSVHAADLDGDGDYDVLSASFYDDKIAWYNNTDGAGDFGPERVLTTEIDSATSVHAADLDGDGDIDILSASADDDKIAWYENTDGTGVFGAQQVISTNADGALSVYAADLDGDGDNDALSASYLDNEITWYEWEQPEEPEEPVEGEEPVEPEPGKFGSSQVISTEADTATSVYAADLDGDDDIDVLSASAGDDKIAWYENTDGTGNFGPQLVISTEADGALAVHAADLDGDGDNDVLSASWGDDKIAWYENTDGAGAFGPQQVITTEALGAFSVEVADVDGDGDMDVLSASWKDDKIAWYENTDGAGAFGPQQVITTEADSATSVDAADVDGDGDIDVLSASFFDNKIAWYENLTPPPPTPEPTPPPLGDTDPPIFVGGTGIASATRLLGNERARVTWHPAIDSVTPQDLIKYNIYWNTTEAGVFAQAPKKSVIGTESGTVPWFGSEDIVETGGAAIHPKAQSFRPRFSQISQAELYMSAPAFSPWEVRILTDLPNTIVGGEEWEIDLCDLERKTAGLASAPSSEVGWVAFNFSPPLSVTSGRTYYLFIGSHITTFGSDTSENWASSEGGSGPGPYLDGTGWIHVDDWNDNSNEPPEIKTRRDYAFRIRRPSELSTIIEGLDPTPSYFIGVRAQDEAGNEDANTKTIEAATPAPTPAPVLDEIVTRVGSHDTPDMAVAVALSGSLVYVADRFEGLQIIDVSDPALPVMRGSHELPEDAAIDVAVSESMAYVANRSAGLQIIDVSDPSAPFQMGSLGGLLERPHLVERVTVSGVVAYTTDFSALHTIGVWDPSAPVLAGSFVTPGTAWGVAVDEPLVHVTDGACGLQFLDATQLSSPGNRGSYDTPGMAQDIALVGSLAYVAAGEAGLLIIDVSDFNAPVLRGSFDTPGNAQAVAVSGSVAYVADGGGGLLVIDVTDPSAPVLRSFYSTEQDALDLVVSDPLIYVAAGELLILRRAPRPEAGVSTWESYE